MTKLPLPLFLAAVAAATAAAAPVPDDAKAPVLFFPTTRASWVYAHEGPGGVGDTEGAVLTATDLARVSLFGPLEDHVRTAAVTGRVGARLVALGCVRGREVTPDPIGVIVSPGGLVQAAVEAPWKCTPYRTLLRVPVVPGESWVAPPTGPDEMELRFTTRGWERVLAPVGQFKAVRVDTAHVGLTGQVNKVERNWYAPGVGLVKFEDDQGRKQLLKRFLQGRD